MQIIGSLDNEFGSPICKMFHSSAAKRSYSYRLHKHLEFEISLILKGTGLYDTNTGVYDIKDNDVFIYSTNEYHCITDIFSNEDNDRMELLNLHFQPAFVWSVGNDSLNNNYLNIFLNRNKNFTNRLDRNNPAIKEVIALMLSIKSEFENKEYDYDVCVKTKVLQLMILIHRNFGFTNENTISVPNQLYKRMETAMNYMKKNYCSDISLEEIAKTAFMAKTYFCTVFKSLNGLTPWQYINILRINKASELLKTTTLSILSIAMQCGYNNTANFNKIFKKITGSTPRQIRDTVKNIQ